MEWDEKGFCCLDFFSGKRKEAVQIDILFYFLRN